jgi:hypothetical protein
VNTQQVAALLQIPLTTEQSRACAYLERLGQRFCVEFGYANAIENAREHWREKRRQQRLRRVNRKAGQ